MKEQVVLVNEDDEVLGLMEKMEAHQKGLLHRAFSIFLYDSSGKILLQRRALGKYHSPGKWTNAVCSHPREGESYLEAAQRRLKEELGIETEIEEKFHFIYKADVGQGLWEHELDYVFVGTFEGEFRLNEKEVSQVKYLEIHQIEKDLIENPDSYTEWFKIIFQKYRNQLIHK